MEEREYIAGKRSGIRRRANGPEKSNKDLITGAIILTIVFILIFSAYSAKDKISGPPKEAIVHEQPQDSGPADESGIELKAETATSPLSKVEGTPVLDIPAPEIIIRSPQDIIYDSTSPPLDLKVQGANLDTVLLSVDGHANVSLPHDGRTLNINFANLDLIFADDFSYGLETLSKGGWQVKTLKDESAIITQEDSYFGIYSAEESLSGKSSDVRIYKSFTYDGKSPFYVDAWMKVVSRSSPSGAFVYIKGYNADNVEKVHIIYHTYDNWDHGTSTPEENKQTFYVLKKHLGNPNYGTWIKIDRNPKEEFDNQFPDVWESLGLTKIMVDLYTWGDGAIKARYDGIVVYKPISNGQHYLTIYANNTAGNSTSISRYFKVNASNTTSLARTGPPGISDTISKDSLAVTLNRYSPIKEITYPSKTSGLYARVHITAKNIGNMGENIKFDTKTILMDDLGNQYIFKKLTQDGEIVQGTLYPEGKKSGTLYFTPAISAKAKKVKLIINIGGEKYEFEFKAF